VDSPPLELRQRHRLTDEPRWEAIFDEVIVACTRHHAAWLV